MKNNGNCANKEIGDCKFNIEEDDNIWDKLKSMQFKYYEEDVNQWQDDCYNTEREGNNYSDHNMQRDRNGQRNRGVPMVGQIDRSDYWDCPLCYKKNYTSVTNSNGGFCSFKGCLYRRASNYDDRTRDIAYNNYSMYDNNNK